MTTAVITGAFGFIGRNLAVQLAQHDDSQIIGLDLENSESDWREALSQADIIFHLAGVNRPASAGEEPAKVAEAHAKYGK